MPPHFLHLKEQSEKTLMPLFIRPVDQLVNYPYQNKAEYVTWKAHQELLKDINYYARLAKQRALTEEELSIRETLRKRYIESVTGSVLDQMKRVQVKDKNGEFQPLKSKKD